ncbi:ATP-dependent Clp protease ATP-binding subunit [Marinactinospora thermotolerans]|uniref:ATP-dependent Clp protease ATP-binding subunit ClpC n=1 Tax=Marinactinospora thermotolerans DSM 45154 TaxID=1122192 RepID=A0A1T4RSK9_9ACTN|nr:ATP-dependent Clp protease ATP-binding subunit [Marinactinospora thermotolerans]SKA18748.1 ATP-dependent Clp protease ATP-binding subunit ClpC [Marinactinospora thermotolerans DSM 45154]
MTHDFPSHGGYDPGSFEEFLARFFGAGGPRRPVRRVDISQLMDDEARQVVNEAFARAAQSGRSDLDAGHILWALLRHEGTRALVSRAGGDPDRLEQALGDTPTDQPVPQSPPTLTPAAKRTLLDAHQIARALGHSYISPPHLLFALAVNDESPIGRLLAESGVTPNTLQAAAGGERPPGQGGTAKSSTPNLDEHGTDLTALAREGRLDPVVGRDEEIEQAIEVLARRRKNNPVLIGDPGVGKTAIAEGIARRITDDDVPETLRGRRLVQLDLAGVVAGTRYRGDFEERLKNLVDEIRANAGQLLIFIDELHTIVGAGAAEGSMSAGNMLKPALARGELHIIGATTIDEYRQNIEKDAALERRFQPILVPEPSVEDTIEILRGLRDRYEAHHQVRFSDESLVAAAELSDRYLTDRFLPDKAIDLMDQAGARVRLRVKTPSTDLRELEQRLRQLEERKEHAVFEEDYEQASALRDEINEVRESIAQARSTGTGGVPEVGVVDIAEVVSRLTSIPVTQLTQEERERLVNLEEHLHARVIGQDEAVTAVAEAIRRSRAGLADPDRPIGSFLFLGPTGVGKTELARALAEALFGSEERMIRFDMSEFQERHTASRLIGAPPGYVGYEEAGQLTEAVRRSPYAVVLLDEIEKAHPDVFNLLLQLLDDGRLTDGQGRTVDFRNVVVIMTSNLGSELITSSGPIGFTAGDGTSGSQLEDRVMKRLREEFRPEFVNRIDEIIVFSQLAEEQIAQITRLMLADTERRLRAQDIDVEFTDGAVRWIAEHGYQPDFGARPLARTIQRNVDNRLSRLLLNGDIDAGDRVIVGVDDDGLSFRTESTPVVPSPS